MKSEKDNLSVKVKLPLGEALISCSKDHLYDAEVPLYGRKDRL